MTENTEGLEIFVGTYEEFVIGYKLQKGKSGYSLEQSFANHAHTGSVKCVSASKGFLASGSTDETIRLFNMKKRTECGALVQHDGTITCLEFYGDSYLLSGSEDGTICVWSTGNWQCQKTLRGHKGGVTCISIHSSGKMLLSVSKDKTLKTWNLVKGRTAYTINLKAVSELVRWSPDGENFVVGINNRVDVYSAGVGGITRSIDFQKRVNAVAFLESTTLALGGDKAEVEVHDLKESKTDHVSFPFHENRVKDLMCVKPSAESERLYLVSVSSDCWLRVWEFDCDKLLSAPSLVAEVDTTCRPTCLAANSSRFLGFGFRLK